MKVFSYNIPHHVCAVCATPSPAYALHERGVYELPCGHDEVTRASLPPELLAMCVLLMEG
jgi:hypothetical protein